MAFAVPAEMNRSAAKSPESTGWSMTFAVWTKGERSAAKGPESMGWSMALAVLMDWKSSAAKCPEPMGWSMAFAAPVGTKCLSAMTFDVGFWVPPRIKSLFAARFGLEELDRRYDFVHCALRLPALLAHNSQVP